IRNWNSQATKIFEWNKDEILGQPLYGVIFPSRYRKSHGLELKKFLESGKELFFNSKVEIYALHRNGHEFPIELSLVAVKTGISHYEFYAFIRDLSQRKHSEQKLIESEHRYRLLFKFSPYSIYEIDLEGNFLSANTAGLQILELSDEEHIRGKPFLESVHPEDKSNVKILFKKATLGITSNFEFTSAGISQHYLKACFIPIEDNAGRVSHLMVLVENITHQKESEMLIWQQANFDSLTKLPNRTMLYDRLTKEIKKTSSSSKLTLALLVIDIDHFKDINVALGHEGGDIFLREAALRLKECANESDLVTRLGGDEFALILSEINDPNAIENIAEKILHNFSDFFELDGQSIHATVSIGISLFPEDGVKMETLLKNAEQAMHAAQTEGGNRYNYFTPFMQKAAQVRLQIANDLRVALDNNEFQLHYQPIIDLKTGEIRKAEALIRWQHPERGLISPVAFIPIAEENRMIIDIGAWVFHEAANQVKRWREAYHPDFQISINKSPVQFHDEQSVHDAWIEHLQKCNLPGESIVIEITEGFLLDINPTVIDRLLKFREAGIQISLDDFGTG
ncbi:MAG: diguanylate cyclase, partial [Methylococcales bacterium]|nr:diguanylate cyclase [Methylococcales bacterium]